MISMATTPTMPIAHKQIFIRGIVQGVGFRPFVYNLARSLGLAGYIFNSSSGVTVEIEGAEEAIDQYFEGVPAETWNFHIGGYQVCEKWLKDRKGRALSYDDIQHWQRIVVALAETRRLMEEIDALIPAWPLQ